MKKLMCAIIAVVISLFVFQLNTGIFSAHSNDEYEFNNPDWTDDEYLEYYAENNILIGSAPPTGSDSKLYSYQVRGHLNNRFPAYSNWTKSSFGGNSVMSTFGGEPIDTYEGDSTIQNAKNQSNISMYDYIGCGPLALVTQFDFLARYAGYTLLATDPDSGYHKTMLYKDIFNTMYTFPYDGDLAMALTEMGFEFEEGTFTFPSDFYSATEQLLLDYNINNGVGAEHAFSNGTYKKLLKISGDTIPNLSSHSAKISKLKSSIDKGMPVVWWTTDNAGDFGNHFMNIFAYEEWVGTNADGQTKTHLMFKVRFNWGIADIYMDSDVLNAINGGFIVFEEDLEKIVINPEDYSLPQQYNNSQITQQLTIDGYNIITKRLRTGYINEKGIAGTGDWHLTMSSRKTGAGTAYMEYNLPKSINYIYFDVRQWSSSEGSNSSNSRAALEYKNSSGDWVESINFYNSIQYVNGFSYLEEYPDKYRADFPYGTTTFRFISTCNSAPTNSTTNKGRIVIGTIGIVFSSNDPNSSELFVSIFSDNGNSGSSSFNFSGHTWIEVFNNSANPVTIGYYTLSAFEGVTVGLYGNKNHTGVYYNLEYYTYLTVMENAASDSSSSSSSSSGWSSGWLGGSSGWSAGNSNSSAGSSGWSAGSFGVISWISSDHRGSNIVGWATGRVSLTEVVSISEASTISQKINERNNEWWIWYNCSHFAIDIWNSVSNRSFDKNWIQTPTNLIGKIEEYNGYMTDRNVFGDRNRVGYYSNSTFVNSTS